MRVISSAIGMYDIMERKVMLVESLEKKRAPFPDMGAIYVLEPSPMSVARLLEDYAKGHVLYGKNVFLYFLGRLPDQLLDQIKGCTALLRRLKCLTEINIDFLTKEERTYTFDMRDNFTSFYLRSNNAPAELMIADKLVTVCGTLNEYPHIRYRDSSALATSLATVFHSKMSDFISQNPSWWYHGGPTQGQQVSSRERATLLLLDRSDDCLTPLMHEYSYQCLVHDLLKMEDDKITYIEDAPAEGGGTKKQPKDVLLDDKDEIWTELRGKHVAEVSQVLSARIREIMNSSAGNVLSKKEGGNLSMSEMADALKALPEFQEILSKLGQHLNLSLECLDIFTKSALKDLAELEQTMATGQNEDLRTPKLADIIDAIESSVMKIKSPDDRLRLLLIATVALGGLRNQDRRRLLNCAELPSDSMKAIDALQIFGIPLVNDDEKNRPLAPFHP
jgi:syntaxin-binding protein 1